MWWAFVSETGSSNVSVVDWDISWKFDVQIKFDLLKRVPSLNSKPVTDLRLYGRHLKISIWRDNSAADGPIPMTFCIYADAEWSATDNK